MLNFSISKNLAGEGLIPKWSLLPSIAQWALDTREFSSRPNIFAYFLGKNKHFYTSVLVEDHDKQDIFLGKNTDTVVTLTLSVLWSPYGN